MVRTSALALAPEEVFSTPPASKKSKGRRKSVLFSPRSEIGPEDASPAGLRKNNDAEEKARAKAARKNEEERRRSISSPFKSPRKGRKPIAPIAQPTALSNEELASLYTNCLKMSSDNKVNIKNAFNLGLIDYMDNLVHDRATNFQKASCTLDAGVKIYSYRVDAVYNDVVKVLGDLSRSSKEKKDEKEENEDGEEGEGGDSNKSKSKKLGSGCDRNIEQKLENLAQKEFEADEFRLDPLFHKTSKAVDNNGAVGLLLNNLGVQRGCRMVFDSQDGATTDEVSDETPSDDLGEQLDLSAFTSKFPSRSQLAAMELTPRLGMFFQKYSKDLMVDYATYESPATFSSDAAKSFKAVNDDVDVYGNDDAGFDDCDQGFDCESVGDADMEEETLRKTIAEDDEMSVKGGEPVLEKDADIFTLAQGGSKNDYSFFNKQLVKNWAGPAHWSHWKAPVGKSSSSAQAASAVTADKKETKDAFSIDFFSDEFESESAFEQVKDEKLNLLSSKAANADTLVLPEDYNYQVSSLFKLFLKPDTQVRRRTAYRGGKVDGATVANGIWYQYDNPEDNNFCPHPEENDDDDCGGADANTYDDDDEAVAVWQMANTEGLVEMPKTVGRSAINYARSSTKVDIKALKDNIWGLLEEEEGKKNIPPKSFKELCESVPSVAKPEEVPAISVSYCFICLLHLANENGLTIKDQEDMSDLIITKE